MSTDRPDADRDRSRGDARPDHLEQDDGGRGDGPDLPPPPPDDAVLTRDAEARIREDERSRVQDELGELAGGERGGGDGGDVTDDRRHDDSTRRRDLDRDGVDDRVERDRTPRDGLDRDGVDDRLADDGGRRGLDGDGVDDRLDDDRGRRRDLDGDGMDDRRESATAERTEYVEDEVVQTRSFSVGQAITLLVGAALTALGILALIETGVDRPLDQPVEDVIGFAHVPWLGIGEVVAGVLLLLAALRPGGKWLGIVVALALIVFGVMVVAEMDWTIDELSAEQTFGWIPIGAGALTLLAAAMTPRRHQTVTTKRAVTRRDDDRR